MGDGDRPEPCRPAVWRPILAATPPGDRVAENEPMEGQEQPLTREVRRAVDLIAGDVKHQNCILFLGAGVHAPPPEGSRFEYAEDQRPPIGSELSLKLADEIKLAEDRPGEEPKMSGTVSPEPNGPNTPRLSRIRTAVRRSVEAGISSMPGPMNVNTAASPDPRDRKSTRLNS